jgi:ABC-2 type transport system ATP-binding protein
VAFFGTALHVSGRDRQALEKALAPFRSRAGLVIHDAPPSLEDVFIQLQEKSGGDSS